MFSVRHRGIESERQRTRRRVKRERTGEGRRNVRQRRIKLGHCDQAAVRTALERLYGDVLGWLAGHQIGRPKHRAEAVGS